ncbi:MAG: hypothetical protein KF861_09945, partial [Planctomycetaceae bacterium]|nr:hypothetical protein [Planctomycetaceae bacterium]
MISTAIPVAEARRIAESYDQQIVVIATYSATKERTNIVTYGVTAAQKAQAAGVGDRLVEILGLGEGDVCEDYRR